MICIRRFFFFFFALFLPPPPAWWRTSKSSCTRLLHLSEATMEPGCVCFFFFLARMRIPVTESQKAQKGGRRRGKTVDSFRKISRIGKKKIALPSYWEGGRILLLCTALERGEKIFCLTRIGFLGGNEGGVCRFALFFLPSFSKLEIALEFLFPLRRPCVRALLFTSNLRIRIWGKPMRSWVSSTSFLSPDLNVLLCCGNFFFFFF